MNAVDHSQMLAELRACAYRLGLAFGGEAERAGTTKERLESFQLFERCFFAVRVATALELRLRRAPLAGAPARDHAERERPDREAAERDRPEREGDRERDRERASLPVLLRTLEEVAAGAEALAGPKPAALPTLRELLAEVTSGPTPPSPTMSGNGGAGPRARLAASVSTPATILVARPVRRPATGPPRR